MASKKLPELGGHEGLGDISNILHNQSVSDLSWLDVDPEEYRKNEALPHQNLDIIPEIQEALMNEGDDRVPRRIPLRPHAIVNKNPLDEPYVQNRANNVNIRDRLASYVIQGIPESVIAQKIRQEFSSEQIRSASSESREVIEEIGLLGNVYIDSKHFPRCAQGEGKDLVKRHASSASYVVAKDSCTKCVHNDCGGCRIYGKKIVSSVPYDQNTFATYAPQLISSKRLASGPIPKSGEELKNVLRVAFTKSPIQLSESSAQTIQTRQKPSKPNISESDVQAFYKRLASKKSIRPIPDVMYLLTSKRVMEGHASVASLRASSNNEIRKLAGHVGLLGYTYVDSDALGGVKNTYKFIQSNKLSPEFIIRRSTEVDSSHEYNELFKISSFITDYPDITRQNFLIACDRAVKEKRMTELQASSAKQNVPHDSDWSFLTAQANLFKPEAQARKVDVQTAQRNAHIHDGYGFTSEYDSIKMDPEEIRRTITHFMNSGKTGKSLQASVMARYSKSDLAQVPEVGQRLASEEGILGHYYIDPTAYLDYGKGCNIGSKSFRKQGPKFILASSSCTGCRLQTAPGWCSKYCKSMIRSVPSEVRRQAAEIKKLPVIQPNIPVENPVEKYELSSELPVDLGGSKDRSIDITINSVDID